MLDQTKTCSACGVEKTLDHFSKRAASRDGLQLTCRECQRVRRAARTASELAPQQPKAKPKPAPQQPKPKRTPRRPYVGLAGCHVVGGLVRFAAPESGRPDAVVLRCKCGHDHILKPSWRRLREGEDLHPDATVVRAASMKVRR